MRRAVEVLKVLVRHNAHVDARPDEHDGKTAMELLEGVDLGVPLEEIFGPPLSRVTLQCLAATQIRKNKIKYKGIVPEFLNDFVELH